MKLFTISIASLSLAACASDVSPEAMERAEHEPYDDASEVAVIAQALGPSDPLYEVCDSLCYGPIAFGAPIASVMTPDGTIMTVEVEQEVALEYTVGTGMSAITAASDGAVYYARGTANGTGNIWRLEFFNDVAIAGTEGTVAGLASDDSFVFWVDDRGLNKRLRSGGGSTITIDDDATVLVGLFGGRLHYLRQLNGGPDWELHRINPNGASHALLRTAGFMWGFSQDATHVFWIEGGPTYRIRRMHKTTTGIDSRHTTTSILYSTAAKDGVLYWSERPTIASQMSIMKRATDGTVTSERTGIYYVPSLLIDGNYLYWLDNGIQGGSTYLKRAAL